MIDVYAQTKDGGLLKLGEGMTREGAKRFIDAQMAAARPDNRPKITAYRFGKFAYFRAH